MYNAFESDSKLPSALYGLQPHPAPPIEIFLAFYTANPSSCKHTLKLLQMQSHKLVLLLSCIWTGSF